MRDRPSDRAIAQAFWEIDADCWTDSYEFEERILERAKEIDASPQAASQDREDAERIVF